MCGIFGHIGYLPKETAQYCTDILAHRGPDGSGVLHTPDVTFGHRRLAILDLSDHAKQPMQSNSGRYWITFNGEIYNFVELRKELETIGYKFKSISDTEVILAAFEEWGENCQDRFNGMWALAIWDTVNNSVFFSRDRFGKKPLFYVYLPNNKFSFASEMKALFPLLKEIKANTDIVKNNSRILNYESSDECVITGIKRFPAGYCGWFKNGKLRVKRWWCTLDHIHDVPSSYDDQVDQFHDLFLDACRLRMRSDVPLGTALSGGLDSSATISCMAHIATHGKTKRMSENWQHAFVASFPGTHLDETKYAKLVAENIGVTPQIIEIDPLQEISKLSHYFYLFEDLYITSPIPFMQTYRNVKKQNISVTLDGHGADELFGGYAFDYIQALNDAGFNRTQASEIIEAYYSAYGNNTESYNLPSKSLFYAKWHSKNIIKKLIKRNNEYLSKDITHKNWSSLDNLNKRLYVSTHETILPTLLRNYDRYSMANGVEIRMPFMDHRIVSFAFSIPWSSKIRNSYSKSIIRDAIAQYMPNEVAYRKTKIGFNSPIVEWMKGPLKEFMLDMISSQSFLECRLIDPEKVANKINYVINSSNAKYTDGEKAWTMLSPYIWERAVIYRENIT